MLAFKILRILGPVGVSASLGRAWATAGRFVELQEICGGFAGDFGGASKLWLSPGKAPRRCQEGATCSEAPARLRAEPLGRDAGGDCVLQSASELLHALRPEASVDFVKIGFLRAGQDPRMPQGASRTAWTSRKIGKLVYDFDFVFGRYWLKHS